MEKNLISEISRINEMMGVKTPSLINESRCLFCEVMTRSIQNLQDLAKKGGIDSRTYNLKLNDLLNKVKGNTDLTPDQRSLLDSVISEFNTLTKTADDIAKQTENAKNVINKRASTNLSKISYTVAEYIIDYVKLYESGSFIDDFFKFSPSTKTNIKSLEDVFSNTEKKETRLNMFDTFDEYFDKSYKLSLSEALAEKGYDESFISKIIEKYRESLKKNPKVGGAWKQTENIEDVVPSRKSDYGDKMLSDVEPTIYKLYSEIIKKNGDQLTQIERDLLDDVKLWTEGKNVSFEKYKPEETINGTDGGNVPTNEIPENFFSQYGVDMDFELLKAMNALSDASDNNKSNVNLLKIINLLKSNKKITEKLLQSFESDFKLLDDVYANKLKSELLNPSGKKLNFLVAFFKTKIDLLAKSWSELWTQQRLSNLAKKTGYGGITYDFTSDTFKKDLQNILLKVKSKGVAPASFSDLQQLKDSFLRLMSPTREMELTYDELWKDLEKYLGENLDPKTKLKWNRLVEQMKSEKTNSWKRLAFSEIIPQFPKMVDDAAAKGTGGAVVTQSQTSKILMSVVETLKGPLISSYVLGSFRTPKQMMQFLMENGYATAGVPAIKGDVFGKKIEMPLVKLSAAGSNFITQYFIKKIIWPAVFAVGYTAWVESKDSALNVDSNGKTKFGAFWESFINNVLDIEDPETEKVTKEIVNKCLPEDFVNLLDYIGYYGPDKQRQSKIYKAYKDSYLNGKVGSPLINDVINVVGFYSQSERTKEQKKEDDTKHKEKGAKDLENAKEKAKTKGDAVARKEFNEVNTVSYRMLSAGEKIAYLDKLGYSELKKRLDEGSYGDGLSYEDCQFVENAIHSYAKLTNDIPIKTVMDGIYVTLVLKVGGKKYKLVPVLRDNDPEGIYGKYPNLDNKFAWIKPDVGSNLSSKTYHGLKEFVDEFK